MNESDKQRLMAYVDGELTESERAAAERLLESDPQARVYVESARKVDYLVREALDEALRRPLPERLLRTIHPPRARGGISGTGKYGLIRVAASVAVLGLGIVLGYGASQWQNQREFAALESANIRLTALLGETVNRALEYQASGMTVSQQVPGRGWAVNVTPLRTFKAEDQRYCREFRQEVVREGIPEVRFGLSCRQGKEAWETRLLAEHLDGRQF